MYKPRTRSLQSTDEVSQSTHKGVAKPTEMCNVTHFLGEDVADIVLARDVKDFEGFVLNPLAHGVLSELDMASGLQCHVVGPEDTGVVVIEHFGGRRYITGRRHPAGFETPGEIPSSDSELAAHAGGVDLRLT